ncbi:MAG: valine--tRNA ligase [Nitrospirota bacterium]|nr:valine--tRNA ligase [Nitrospirota bacterium]
MSDTQEQPGNPGALDKQYAPHEVEARWYPKWEQNGDFKPAGHGPAYSIVIPPPNVTGSLHMGHALNDTLQDLLIRWRRMRGDNALWVPGCDHAGIATQNVVEKQLAREGKQRTDLGRDKFIERVWNWKEESGGTIMGQLRRLGASCDWSRERFTMDPGLSEAVREVFVSLYEEGLIYRGDYLVNWCPRCESALSDLEVEHEEVRGHLYHLHYRVAGSSRTLTIATTRPETLLGDTAVAVHPEDDRYADLLGGEALLPLLGRPLKIIADAYVDMEFGTGALKVTPGHDPNDFELGRKHNLPVLSVMDTRGHMAGEAAGPYAGMSREACRTKIVADLQDAGLLAGIEEHTHSVGHCYRCKTVVEPIISTQWFVKVQPLAAPAIDAVKDGRIRFVPDNWKNTYFEWMENIRDWCISRQIWWGHRIPAWYCPCGHVTVARRDPSACAGCGGTDLRQETDVLDTWFSSALWPFSTMGWPQRTDDLATFYPTSTLVTGFDIIFFWVARMIMMGLKFMGDVPFREVYVHALVRDAQGQKMSKSKGNVVDPLTIMDQYGTDAFRFTLAAMASPGRDIRLAEDRIAGYRNFCNKLWNAARFVQMNLPPYQPPATDLAAAAAAGSLAEKWIAGRFAQTAAEVNRQLSLYRFDEAARVLYNFVWGEYCDWYLELAKPNLSADDPARAAATRAVLLGVMDGILRLLHPFMPFITEEIRDRLPHPDGSILHASYPTGEEAPTDAEAEAVMDALRDVIVGVRGARASLNISPAKPLSAVLKTPDAATARHILDGRPWLERLARVEHLEAGPDCHSATASFTAVLTHSTLQVPLKGLIDPAVERARLEGQLRKLVAERDGIERKLANESFVARAPQDIVERDRQRCAELTDLARRLEESLALIAGLED